MDTVTPADFLRLETKLDKMADAIGKLVLVEERQITQTVRINGHDIEIAALKVEMQKTNDRVSKFMNQLTGAALVLSIVVEAVRFYYGK